MKLTAVIFDWAGTLADFGSCGPVAAFRNVFSEAGVPITNAEARAPMGLAKRAHLEAILKMPRVNEAWVEMYKRDPLPKDVDELYEAFVPRQLAVLEKHSELIPGVVEAVDRMRTKGLKIGSTTGYNRAMLDYLVRRAGDQGLTLDFAACPDDVPSGRPHPFMCYLNALKMEVEPMWSMVKIGDTPADIEEGKNAGMWTIGITRTGNEIGHCAEEWAAASVDEKTRRLACAHEVLSKARPHYIAESVADCDAILHRIQNRLERGGRP